jgi:hypothetical protein
VAQSVIYSWSQTPINFLIRAPSARSRQQHDPSSHQLNYSRNLLHTHIHIFSHSRVLSPTHSSVQTYVSSLSPCRSTGTATQPSTHRHACTYTYTYTHTHTHTHRGTSTESLTYLLTYYTEHYSLTNKLAGITNQDSFNTATAS